MELIRSNLWEINKSAALKYFGGVLALTHLLSYFLWSAADIALPLHYYQQATPMCWPLWPDCSFIRILPPHIMQLLFQSYPYLAGLTLILFVSQRLIGLAWFLLILLLAQKSFLYFQDYRLSSNAHYALVALHLVFLFFPQKNRLLRFLFISFLVAMGLFRLNPEWLSGAALLADWSTHPKLAEWFAAISTLTLLIAPVVLLLRSARAFWFSTLALVLLFSFQWYISGFFAPAVYLAILSFFVIDHFERSRLEREFIYQSFIRPEPSRGWVVVGLLIFWIFQFIPFIPQTENQWVKPLGQVLAIYNRPIAAECSLVNVLNYQKGHQLLQRESQYSGELKCDPYARFLEARELCTSGSKDLELKAVSSYFLHRGLKDAQYQRLFEIKNICQDGLNFKQLGI